MRKKRPTKKKTINNKDIPLSSKEKPKTELTEVEQFWVEQKCRDGASLDEVKSQNIQPVALVEQVYKKIKAEITEPERPKASNFFGRNEKYGAVVMTQNASEFGDDIDGSKKASKSKKAATHIHKFR
jgi:hypothetical protein